jgi:hypothetical protein
MKNILTLIIGIALGAAGFWFVSSRHIEKPDHEKPAEEKTDHDADVIKLDKKQQDAAGVETALPEPVRLPVEVKGYGRVLDPAQFVSLALDVQAARATAEASKKELERLKTLYAQGQNASARALETAEAAAKRDETLLNVAEARLRAALGPTIVDRKDFPDLIEALSRMRWAVARIDTLSGGTNEFGSTVRIAPLSNENASVPAELLGTAPVADVSIQGRGFLALIKTNFLAPNTTVIGSIEVPGKESKGFLIPIKALLQEGPETIVVIQANENEFRKVRVEVERMTDKGAFVTEGLAATNRVVVAGAHQVLSVTKAEAAD